MSTKPCPKKGCSGTMRTTITDYGVMDQRFHEIPLENRYQVMKCHTCGHVEETPISPEKK